MNVPVSNAVHQWRVSGANEILWAEWDGDFVAFHRPSGKTHWLNTASHELLTRILLEPRTTATVLDELATGIEEMVNDEVAAEIEELLFRLDKLGLVMRI